MISRWKDVAKRTAERLNIPVEKVIAEIEKVAYRTQVVAAHPEVMEIELFGIGALQASFSKLKRALISHESRIRYHNKLKEKYTKTGNTLKIQKAEETVESFESDLIKFQEFLDIKEQFAKHGKKRKDYEREYIEENGDRHERARRKKQAAKAQNRNTLGRGSDNGSDRPLPFPGAE